MDCFGTENNSETVKAKLDITENIEYNFKRIHVILCLVECGGRYFMLLKR